MSSEVQRWSGRWEDFIQLVRRTAGRPRATRIFRGHGDPAWNLTSAFERWVGIDSAGRARIDLRPELLRLYEKDFLNRFKRLSVGLPGIERETLCERDWWVIGRHFGLLTPLLDWSRSPYVAAFFAAVGFAERSNPGFWGRGVPFLKGFQHEPGAFSVWSLTLTENVSTKPEGTSTAPWIEVIEPEIDFSVPAHRIRAQQSVLTWLHDESHTDLEAHLASRNLTAALECYDIEATDILAILKDLYLMNITFSTLFPDLTGAALQANLSDTFEVFGP